MPIYFDPEDVTSTTENEALAKEQKFWEELATFLDSLKTFSFTRQILRDVEQQVFESDTPLCTYVRKKTEDSATPKCRVCPLSCTNDSGELNDPLATFAKHIDKAIAEYSSPEASNHIQQAAIAARRMAKSIEDMRLETSQKEEKETSLIFGVSECGNVKLLFLNNLIESSLESSTKKALKSKLAERSKHQGVYQAVVNIIKETRHPALGEPEVVSTSIEIVEKPEPLYDWFKDSKCFAFSNSRVPLATVTAFIDTELLPPKKDAREIIETASTRAQRAVDYYIDSLQ